MPAIAATVGNQRGRRRRTKGFSTLTRSVAKVDAASR